MFDIFVEASLVSASRCGNEQRAWFNAYTFLRSSTLEVRIEIKPVEGEDEQTVLPNLRML